MQGRSREEEVAQGGIRGSRHGRGRELSAQVLAAALEHRRKRWDENGLEVAASRSKKKISDWIRRKKSDGE
jgi:predicted GNAT family N-acyltransferase